MADAPIEPSRIYLTRRYRDCPAMIDWLVDVVGFRRHFVVDDGAGGIAHAQLALGSALIMVGSARDDDFGRAVGEPGAAAGDGTSVYIAVDDADALCARTIASGVEVPRPVEDTDYGSREFSCRDLEGLYWNFGTYWPKASETVAGS